MTAGRVTAGLAAQVPAHCRSQRAWPSGETGKRRNAAASGCCAPVTILAETPCSLAVRTVAKPSRRSLPRGGRSPRSHRFGRDDAIRQGVGRWRRRRSFRGRDAPTQHARGFSDGTGGWADLRNATANTVGQQSGVGIDQQRHAVSAEAWTSQKPRLVERMEVDVGSIPTRRGRSARRDHALVQQQRQMPGQNPIRIAQFMHDGEMVRPGTGISAPGRWAAERRA